MKSLFSLMLYTSILGHAFGQKPDYSGTWVFNAPKSQLESQMADSASKVFVIKQQGNQFNLVIKNVVGTKKRQIHFKMIADGKTRRAKLLFKEKLTWQGNTLQAILWRKNFSNTVNYQFGNNQNELIAEETFIGKSHRHHNIWFFERTN